MHTDLCGPMSIQARGGYEYFITFTDDYTRFGYVYLMRHKSDAFDMFKAFKAEVETQLDEHIKILRSDRGGEYLSGKTEKMESRSETCIFVGYPKETKGYYFYSPSDLKVFVSTNVKILEKDYMNDFVPKSIIVLNEMSGDTIPQEVTQPSPIVSSAPSQNQQPTIPRRSGRVSRKPERYIGLGESMENLPDDNNPYKYKEVMEHIDGRHWKKTMQVAKIQIWIKASILILEHKDSKCLDSGSLMYAMLCTRPDICFAVGIVSRFQSKPGPDHWTTVKHIFKYFRRTKDNMLVYLGGDLIPIGYTYSDFQSDSDSRKSTSGFVFTIGGGAIIWRSIKQSCIADSTMEVEYVAAYEVAKEAVWLHQFLIDLEVVPSANKQITIYCDNSGAVPN
ncbi:hypothetical protein Q3G72_027257 [Acer saccharum]|nr:hypothetical protein Q3G72_027257 [Acer saccharum]